MVWLGSSSSSVWEVASEEDDCGLAGPDPDGGASPPPVVGILLGGAMALTVAEVVWHPCSLRASTYLSRAFLKASGVI